MVRLTALTLRDGPDQFWLISLNILINEVNPMKNKEVDNPIAQDLFCQQREEKNGCNQK